MSLWYVVRLTTYLDLKSISRFKDPARLQVESYISDKQFQQKKQHLARYVSHHNAMAYDSAVQGLVHDDAISALLIPLLIIH
jgi:hypothetical protein